MKNELCLLGLLACSTPACGSSDDGPGGDGTGGTPGVVTGSGGAMGGSGGGAIDDPTNEPGPTLAMDECGLDTGFAGDEFCILPPPPDQGFQVHVGPDDYDNPDALYVLDAGEEATDDFRVFTDNQEEKFFYYRQYRMRPTAHHMIVGVMGEGSISPFGRRIGTANAAADYPAGGISAPENEGVGLPVPANAEINVSLHAINVTNEPELREIWVNFWYRDAADVTEVAEQWFKMGDIGFSVQPFEETTLGPYTCDVPSEGRMLWFYGHRHANNTRFLATRVRGGQRDVIYDGYHWEEPMLLQYNSAVENPAADPANQLEGGWSGILDLLPGDKIEWECEIKNQQDAVLRFTDQTYLGEMCIVDAEAVGTGCNGL